MPELERAFGAWSPGNAPAKRIASVPATLVSGVYLIDKPGAPQSVIVAAHVSEAGRPAGGSRDRHGHAQLRRHRHLAPQSQPAPRQALELRHAGLLLDARGQRPFIVIAPVQTDKTKESIVEVQGNSRGIAGARPIRGEEFASIMRMQTLGLPGRLATLAALEAAAVQLLNYRYPDDYFSTFAAQVAALERSRSGMRPRRKFIGRRRRSGSSSATSRRWKQGCAS